MYLSFEYNYSVKHLGMNHVFIQKYIFLLFFFFINNGLKLTDLRIYHVIEDCYGLYEMSEFYVVFLCQYYYNENIFEVV